jgi:hypothetical protein
MATPPLGASDSGPSTSASGSPMLAALNASSSPAPALDASGGLSARECTLIVGPVAMSAQLVLLLVVASALLLKR